jgi:hypothetical protein
VRDASGAYRVIYWPHNPKRITSILLTVLQSSAAANAEPPFVRARTSVHAGERGTRTLEAAEIIALMDSAPARSPEQGLRASVRRFSKLRSCPGSATQFAPLCTPCARVIR